MKRALKDLISIDLAIDMGTSYTRVFSRGRGLEIEEPSCVAVSGDSGEALCAGRDAWKMIGRCPPHIEIAHPLAQGVVMDFDLAELMLREFLRRLMKNRALFGARVLMCVPAGATDVETRAFQDVAAHAGARNVQLIHAPVAAAIGLGLPIERPQGTAIVLLGGGTTQAAVFSGGQVILDSCAKVGGQDMNDAISSGIRRKLGVQTGSQTVEQLKTALASAYPMETEETRGIYGKDLLNGLPRAVTVANHDIREMIAAPLDAVMNAVKTALENVPPELAEDIKKNGITLAGGCAQLRGLGRLIEEIMGVPCSVAKKGSIAAIHGADKTMGDPRAFARYLVPQQTRKLVAN